MISWILQLARAQWLSHNAITASTHPRSQKMFAENDRSAPLQDPPLHKTVDPGRHDPLDEDDRAALEAIGKTQAFHRKFNFWSALGFTVCISGTVRLAASHVRPLLTLTVGRHCSSISPGLGPWWPRWPLVWLHSDRNRNDLCRCCNCRACKVSKP